jgi:hypothetical protein
MKAVVIYESMYGNTHRIANAIAEGLRSYGEAAVVPVHEAQPPLVESADVVIVGGPTHVHGMSRAATRTGAVVAAEKPGSGLMLDSEADPDAPGLREWFASLGEIAANAAAFDTRLNRSVALTGRASKSIARELRHHGAALIAEPQSFFVTKDNELEPNEEARAREWGAQLARDLTRHGMPSGRVDH